MRSLLSLERVMVCPLYATLEEMMMDRYHDMLRTEIREHTCISSHKTLSTLVEAEGKRARVGNLTTNEDARSSPCIFINNQEGLKKTNNMKHMKVHVWYPLIRRKQIIKKDMR